MAIYAIADLHLSFDERVEKPMSIYGKSWENHEERLKNNWENNISHDDVVIIAGDISWALKPEEALADLEWIHRLPGKKVLIKGNHELWWQSITKLNKLYDNMFFLQNTFYPVDETAICGTRGWICPGTDGFSQQDEKIYKRELLRMEMSLSEANKAGYKNVIVMMHYPPTNDKQQCSGFTELFEKYDVSAVYYGHLHGKDVWPKGLQGNLNGVEYRLISLDYIDANPLKIK